MPQVVVAGGGLAGAAAAAGLAQRGAEVVLIERQLLPVHKICGEFLSIEAQRYLEALGLRLQDFQPAEISRLRLVRGARWIETGLNFAGIGLSRKTLDEALLLQAQRSGVRVLRGRAIRQLRHGPDLAVEVAGERRMPAETLLLATGKHDLRGAGRQAASRPDLIGFKMYFRLAPGQAAALARTIELILFRGGYAGLQLVENGIANLCLLVKREVFAGGGGNWQALLRHLQAQSPHLAARLEDAVPQWRQPLAVYRIPYGFIHRHRAGDPARLFRLGDQACVIPSFTGDGMAIALHSAALAVRAIENGEDARQYHRRLNADIGGQMRRAGGLDRLLNHPATQPAVFELARRWPAILRKSAALTRVPARARLA